MSRLSRLNRLCRVWARTGTRRGRGAQVARQFAERGARGANRRRIGTEAERVFERAQQLELPVFVNAELGREGRVERELFDSVIKEGCRSFEKPLVRWRPRIGGCLRDRPRVVPIRMARAR